MRTIFLAVLAVLAPSTHAFASSRFADAPRRVHLPADRAEGWHLGGSLPFDEAGTSLRLDYGSPQAPIDEGGGVSAETRQIMALLFGLLLGFGTGHLIAHDSDGFILFLALDIGIIVLATVLDIVVHTDLFWVFGGLALLVSHIIQGIDAYAAAGGPRLVDRAREDTMVIASRRDRDAPTPAIRFYSFSF